MTEAKFSLEPLPEKLEALKEGIKSALRAYCDEAQRSHKQHQDLSYEIYAAAARLNTILNQKLSEIESFSRRKETSLKLSKQKILLWSLITSTLGGLFSGLLIAALLIATASEEKNHHPINHEYKSESSTVLPDCRVCTLLEDISDDS